MEPLGKKQKMSGGDLQALQPLVTALRPVDGSTFSPRNPETMKP